VSHFNNLAVMGRKFVEFLGITTLATAGNVQLKADQLLGGVLLRDCAGAARSDQLPTAQAIIDYLTISGRQPVVGNAAEFFVRNTSAGAFAVTLTTNTGLLLAGTMVIPQSQQGRYFAVVGGSGVVTIMSMGVGAF
jgi:hypothetical protein